MMMVMMMMMMMMMTAATTMMSMMKTTNFEVNRTEFCQESHLVFAFIQSFLMTLSWSLWVECLPNSHFNW
eukprot:8338288-Karenia_brevis.AAC.1